MLARAIRGLSANYDVTCVPDSIVRDVIKSICGGSRFDDTQLAPKDLRGYRRKIARIHKNGAG
jgi:hypothetical protein